MIQYSNQAMFEQEVLITTCEKKNQKYLPTAVGKQYFKFELYQNDKSTLEFNHTNRVLCWQGSQTLAQTHSEAETGMFFIVLYIGVRPLILLCV
jgi:hypothetical protein